MDIILASGSPRRRELMEMLGVKNLQIIPAQGEEALCDGMTAEETVAALSLEKAREVAAKCEEGALVIAADTVVELDGDILGKPKSEDDAHRMLGLLSGRTHRVYTGISILLGGNLSSAVERTDVTFRELADREISGYVATGEPMDKAGAYGAQGLASLFVEGIRGDFFNVMGLPLCRLGTMLNELGVNLI